MIKSNIKRCSIIFLFMTLFLGIFYPLSMTAIGQVAFNEKVNGSIIEVDGVSYGSELLGQNFVEDKHLWGRPVSQDNIDTSSFTDGDKRYYFAYPSNLSTESEEFQKWVEERKAYILLHNPTKVDELIPSELIYGSGSGLDPHISYETALYQVDRLVSSYSGVYNENQIIEIIDKCSEKKWFNIFGDKLTNVLMVNLYLEGIL